MSVAAVNLLNPSQRHVLKREGKKILWSPPILIENGALSKLVNGRLSEFLNHRSYCSNVEATWERNQSATKITLLPCDSHNTERKFQRKNIYITVLIRRLLRQSLRDYFTALS